MKQDTNLILEPEEQHKLLIHAIKEHNLSLIMNAISLGADVTANDNEAICVAAKTGQISILQTLIDSGADPFARYGEPVRIAYRSGNEKLYKYITKQVDMLDEKKS